MVPILGRGASFVATGTGRTGPAPPWIQGRITSIPAPPHGIQAATPIIAGLLSLSRFRQMAQTMKALVKREANKGIWLEQVP
ncbi:hypothetical protein GEV940_22605, partial [Xanthomonas perforans]